MNNLKIGLLLTYISIASLAAAAISPGLHDIKISMHLSDVMTNAIVSVFLVGYLIGQLVYGPFANRFGRLNTLRAGLLIYIIGSIICLIAGYLNLFGIIILGRFLSALGASAGLAITYTLIHESLSKEKAKQALSFSVFAFSVGISLIIFISGLITQYFSWYSIFWLLLFHGIVMFFLTWQFKETLTEQKSINIKNIFQDYSNAFKDKNLIFYAFIISLLAIFSYGYTAFSPIYCSQVLTLSPQEYGSYSFINTIGMIGGSFLSNYLMKKTSPERTIFLLLIMMIPLLFVWVLIALGYIVSTSLFFVMAMFFYLFLGAIMGPGSYLATKSLADKAIGSGVMSFINVGAATLIVSLMGLIPLSSILQFTVVFVSFFLLISLLSLRKLFSNRYEAKDIIKN
ncbi:MFS transporter [Paraphotobacterium marinum]|uniref:MFS transporter n=1 Tax=Paraphotobacterium marinum TaxID=1755811 RepID=A0A220VGZ9_9GAMM|nr:MFS transporter [Paraphotobacterium marinum]ASK79526.1 MFS transporter [Paraphotobacterium marinum]